MDSVFVQGIAGFLAAIMVFCGSIWLLLALVLGARLAYFVSASVTLAFILVMATVWSFGTPLGPVGVLPEWDPVGIAEQAAQIDFGPATEYPDGNWRAPDPDDQAEATKAGELEGDATDLLEQAIADGKITAFAQTSYAKANRETVRLIEVDGVEYGALTFEPAPVLEGEVAPKDAPDPDARVVAVMSYDPGNPFGKARLIWAGTFLLFAGHLVGLNRSERAAKKRAEA